MSDGNSLQQPPITPFAVEEFRRMAEEYAPKPDSMYMLVCHPSRIAWVQVKFPAQPTGILAFTAGNYPGTTVPLDPDALCPRDKWFVVTHQVRDEYETLRQKYGPMMAASIVAGVIKPPHKTLNRLNSPFQMMTIPK